MIIGIVTGDREATIRLAVQGTDGEEQELEAVIDTGFNGSLTLSPSIIAELGLTWLTQERVMLGDGRVESFDVYAAMVLWDGRLIRVMVDAADTDPLVGMALMYGYELNVQNVEGGAVTLERFSSP